MKRINRLLIEAKAIQHSQKELIYALIEREGDSWIAKAYVLDKARDHTPEALRSEHASIDAAVEFLHGLAWEYQNGQDVTIIVDNI